MDTRPLVALDFAAPGRLWLLVLAVGLVAGYVTIQIRRRRDAGKFANPALMPLLAPNRVGWWRHLLAGLFLCGLIVATVGAAQPTVPGEEKREQATIILAVDTSDSMKATDVSPSRIEAAVVAAKAFVADLPSSFSVGVVTASSNPALIVAPTTDHLAVETALDHLELHPGTALGEAIFTALSALPREVLDAARTQTTSGSDPTEDSAKKPAASIVLLSDGKTTTGRPDAEAIQAAVDAGVAVSTIAFGTDDPDVSVESAGVTVKVPVDSSALQAIAEGTEGQFFAAASGAELSSVYDEIDAGITIVATDRDVAEYFAAAALLILVAAAVTSLLTTSRVVWT